MFECSKVAVDVSPVCAFVYSIPICEIKDFQSVALLASCLTEFASLTGAQFIAIDALCVRTHFCTYVHDGF